MKYLFINSVCGYGSTGKIVVETCKKLTEQGHECAVAWGRICTNTENISTYRIGGKIDNYLHALGTRLFDNEGFCSKRATKRLISWIMEYKPDVIWLHNLHGYYLNIELLFQYIKTIDVEVLWTLHDCWAFTGHCGYFSMVKCDRWKISCEKCPQKKSYPSSYFFDNSKANYARKKNAFTGISNMKLIVPSKWLKGLVEQSFLKEYEIEVIYNEVNRNVFKPVSSDFKERNHIENRVMVLGVANIWDKRKGLQDFVELSKRLDKNIYKIVLVGLSEKQIKELPANILGMQRTNGIEELAEIYSAADIFINPSKEETFGMTTVEAQLCGAKVIVYKDTAGEEIVEQFGGVAVKQSVDALYAKVVGLSSDDNKLCDSI